MRRLRRLRSLVSGDLRLRLREKELLVRAHEGSRLQLERLVAVEDLLHHGRGRLRQAHETWRLFRAIGQLIQHAETVDDVFECGGHVSALRLKTYEQE